AGDGFAGPALAESLLGWDGDMHLAVSVEGQLWGVLVFKRRATAWRELDLYRAGAVASLVTQLVYMHRTRHAEQRFQALTRQAPIGILHYNEQGTVLYRNEYLVELLGTDYSRFTREEWSRIATAEDGDIEDDVAQMQRHGRLLSRYRITRPDGSQRHVVWHVLSDQIKPDAAQSGRIGIAIDVTEQWQMQQQLRDLSAFQRTILDNAAHPIVASDVAGKITLFNPAAERLLGYSAAEILGRLPSFTNPPEELEALADAVQAANFLELHQRIMVKAEREGSIDNELHVLHKLGHRIPVRISTTALLDASGKAQGLLSIVVDQSDRLRLAELEQREQTLVMQIGRGTSAAVGEQFFEQLINALQEATGADYTNIFMLRPELDGLQGTLLKDPQIASLDTSLLSYTDAPLEPVMRDGISIHLRDAQADYPHNPYVKALQLSE